MVRGQLSGPVPPAFSVVKKSAIRVRLWMKSRSQRSEVSGQHGAAPFVCSVPAAPKPCEGGCSVVDQPRG